MKVLSLRSLLVILVIFSITALVSCAGFAPSPDGHYLYYHKELPEADRAVEAARAAGKDKACPKEFAEAENLKNKAYEEYWACRTEEAIAMSNEATKKANALCPAPPPPALAPKPPSPPPPPPKTKVIDRLTLEVNFDLDKAVIRNEDKAKLQEAVDFVRKHRGSKVKIEGHTDSIGTEEYNQRLSERRADAVSNFLVKEGACEAANIMSVGYGETRPVALNNTQKGRAQNRRVEILILSE